MLFFKRYGIFLMVINTLLIQFGRISIIRPEMIFYVLMGFSLLLLFLDGKGLLKLKIRRYFPIALLISVINILYFVFYASIDKDVLGSFLYLLAKTSTFILIIWGIWTRPKFYNSVFFEYVNYFIIFFLILGCLLNDIDPKSGRLAFGFGNSNSAGFVGALSFAITLIRGFKYKNLKIFVLIFVAIVVMLSGSRGALILICLAIFFKYKFSFKFIFPIILFAVISFFLEQSGATQSSFDRLMNSMNEQGEIVTYRERENYYGWLTALQEPIVGHGLSMYGKSDLSLVPVILRGEVLYPHNGYICLFIMYGFIVGTLFLLILSYYTLLYFFKYIRSKDSGVLLHLFIIVSVLIKAATESYIIGVNELATVLFWVSICYLSFYDKMKKYV